MPAWDMTISKRIAYSICCNFSALVLLNTNTPLTHLSISQTHVSKVIHEVNQIRSKRTHSKLVAWRYGDERT